MLAARQPFSSNISLAQLFICAVTLDFLTPEVRSGSGQFEQWVVVPILKSSMHK
jgi:hypothetical protein